MRLCVCVVKTEKYYLFSHFGQNKEIVIYLTKELRNVFLRHTQMHHAHLNIMCTYFPDIISLEVSDIEDDSILDQQDAAMTTTDMETPNTFGCNLLRRLGLAQGSEAEATGSSSNNKDHQNHPSTSGPSYIFKFHKDSFILFYTAIT